MVIFRLALIDLGVTRVLPPILRVIGTTAPEARIQVEPASGARLANQLSARELPQVRQRQWRHRRFDSDARRQWLREQVRHALA